MTPLNQIAFIKDSLVDLGYHEPYGTVVSDYEFVIDKGRKGHADLIAFANPRRCDISTSCIAVKQLADDGDKWKTLRELRYIGAPLALLALIDKVEFWPVISADQKAPEQPHEVLYYNRLTEYFNRYSSQLSPESLFYAKTKSKQLSFFHIDFNLGEEMVSNLE